MFPQVSFGGLGYLKADEEGYHLALHAAAGAVAGLGAGEQALHTEADTQLSAFHLQSFRR